ncbi:hypothetical protein [Pseudophaeobacter sp.]|uniref:hypothetical protein n=1 Tax=Pseudophaeobacter sp. TaxID=1971739 RepID=UPI003A97FC18
MKNTVSLEFTTVDLLLKSDAETRAVDAFAISWVKLEKQLRRLTSNLLFQHSAFEEGVSDHKAAIRTAILRKATGNHDRFIGAIYRLSNHSVKDMIGDRYRDLKRDTSAAYRHRNKILHGQQTGWSLTRPDLERSVSSMWEWCELLAAGADEHIGYDGFSRDSLRKNRKEGITQAVDKALADGWEEFIRGI